MTRDARSPAVDVVPAQTTPHRFNPMKAHITPASRQIAPMTPRAITTRDHFTPSPAQREILVCDRKTIAHHLHVIRDRFPMPGGRVAPKRPRPPTPRRHAPCTLGP